MHLHPGLRSATLQLAPAELGRLSIRIRVDDERVHAVLRVESKETLHALERNLPELEAAFADQGFKDMHLEMQLEQGTSGQNPFGTASLEAPGGLSRRIETELNHDLGARENSSAIGVDTYA